MFDTLKLRLDKRSIGSIDLLAEVPYNLSNISEHNFENGFAICGNLDNIRCNITEYNITIEGSICKWYLGDNLQTMGRGDTQRAIEKLSDELKIPIDKANVLRIDIANNFILKHSPEIYLNHLGTLQYAKRLPVQNGLYYNKGNKMRLCFYDKIKEQKHNSQIVPELYHNRNVLRYELRYMGNIARQLKCEHVTASNLYNDQLYNKLLNNWQLMYHRIRKINDVILNFTAMKTKTDLYNMGVLSLIEQCGGYNEILQMIQEGQTTGQLTRKQAYDLKQAINNASKIKEDIVTENESIKELDKKVDETIKFYS